jgi:hypothetical protein
MGLAFVVSEVGTRTFLPLGIEVTEWLLLQESKLIYWEEWRRKQSIKIVTCDYEKSVQPAADLLTQCLCSVQKVVIFI